MPTTIYTCQCYIALKARHPIISGLIGPLLVYTFPEKAVRCPPGPQALGLSVEDEPTELSHDIVLRKRAYVHSQPTCIIV